MEKLAYLGCLAVTFALVLLCSLYAAAGWLLMVLWNFLIGSGFHGPTITFWDGTGMIVLVSALAGYLLYSSRRRAHR